MPRHARALFPGVPHHVTQRGNHRATVFFEQSDGVAYLRLLRKQSDRHSIEIVAYCLMPNHVHLVLVPMDASGLHQALRAVHGQFARRINRMRERIGHLWQDRYFSSPLDSSYFMNAVRYVELNPVRAGFVARAEDYAWSSASAHCGSAEDPVVGHRPRSVLFNRIEDWSHWLKSGLTQECLDKLRSHGRQNLPCGSPSFVDELGARAGRPLQFRPHGRPAKAVEKERVSAPFLKR